MLAQVNPAQVLLDYLQGKVSQRALIHSVNKELFLAYDISDVQVVKGRTRTQISWVFRHINGTRKTARSTYDGPVDITKTTRIIQAMEAIGRQVRAPAAIPLPEIVIPVKDAALDEDFEWSSHGSLSLSGGMVEIQNAERSLRFNLMQFSGSYLAKWEDYTFSATLGLVRFSNLAYSDARGDGTVSSIFQEYRVQLSKQFDKYGLGLDYSLLNYIFLKNETETTYVFQPEKVSRFSAKGNYRLKDDRSFSASLGYLFSANVSGFDYSLSANYHFGDELQFQFSPGIYGSQLAVNTTSNDSSFAFMASFAILFP